MLALMLFVFEDSGVDVDAASVASLTFLFVADWKNESRVRFVDIVPSISDGQWSTKSKARVQRTCNVMRCDR